MLRLERVGSEREPRVLVILVDVPVPRAAVADIGQLLGGGRALRQELVEVATGHALVDALGSRLGELSLIITIILSNLSFFFYRYLRTVVWGGIE